MNDLIWAVFCHMIGDYVLQSDYIAKTKGENWYHLIVHCVLYCVPFAVVFGVGWTIAVLFVHHLIVDNAKARLKVLSYTQDQIMHYIALIFLLVTNGGVMP